MSGSTGKFDWKKLALGAIGGLVGTAAMRYYWRGATRLHGEDPRRARRPTQDDLEPFEVLETHGSHGGHSRDRPRTMPSAVGASGSTGGGLRTAGSIAPAEHVPPVTEPESPAPLEGPERHRSRRRKETLPVVRPEVRYRRDETASETLARLAYEQLRGHEPIESTKHRIAEAIEWAYGAENGVIYGALRAGRHRLDAAGGVALGAAMWATNDEVLIPALGLAPGPQKAPLKHHLHRLGAHLTFGVATAAVTQTIWNMFGGNEA